MTESEWLECTDLTPMLIYLRGEVEPPEAEPDTRPRLITGYGELVFGEGRWVSPRRLGRFAQEVCKRWWDLPLDGTSQHLVVSYERFLAGDGSWDEFVSTCLQVWETARGGGRPLIGNLVQWCLNPYGIASVVQNLAWVTACHRHRERIEELERTASEDDRFAWGFFGYDFPEFGATANTVRQPLPALLREVVGNPFRPVQPLPPAILTWNGGTVLKLAQVIQDECRFLEMPVLVDALEEAGCDNKDILAHLRGPGPHVRGCWALDLILGKE